MPVERVRRPAVLLLHQRPLEPRPPLPAVLAGVKTAGEAGLDRLALDLRHHVLREAPAAPLCLLLERHQHVLGEAASALLQGQGPGVELQRGRPRWVLCVTERLDLHRLSRLTCD